MLGTASRRCFSFCRQALKGHSHWQNIKEVKGKNDAKRSLAISLLLKKARKALTQTGGFDLKLNRELAAVEAEFKAKSLPLDSLRSFLQKMKDKPDYEMSFDIIGPSGSLFIVQAEADGKMKVENQLRKYFNKIGGFRLANDGVKNWFRETGVVVVCPEKDGEKVAFEKMEEYAIELDCENVLSIEDDDGVKYELQCEIKNLSKVEKQLQNDGFKVESAEIEYRPLHPVTLQGDDSVQVEKLYEMFQTDEYIKQVFDNIQPE